MFRLAVAAVLIMLALVSGAGAAVPSREAELRGALESWLVQRTEGLGWETRIRRLQAALPTGLPAGTLEYEVVAPDQWEGWGAVSVAIIIRREGRVVLNLPARLEVEATAEVVVAARQIDHGSVITAADVTLQRRELSGAPGRLARGLADVIGKKTRVTVKANQPLRGDQLERPPLVKSGQLVTIVAENEVIRVSVAGKARGAGAEGDVIMVQNVNSLKEMPARVVSATTVQVAF